jgi:hypothetical protein
MSALDTLIPCPGGSNVLEQEMRTQVNKGNPDWRYGSSNRAPVLQAQSPVFKPQTHQKNKKKFYHKIMVAENYKLRNKL